MTPPQCPGCGSMRGCECTPADIRAQLEKDRAELSNRAAEHTRRANVLIGALQYLAACNGGEGHMPEYAKKVLDACGYNGGEVHSGYGQ